MSRYSDKHRAPPRCARQECPRPGTELRAVRNVPQWLCDLHATEVDTRATEPRRLAERRADTGARKR